MSNDGSERFWAEFDALAQNGKVAIQKARRWLLKWRLTIKITISFFEGKK